MATPQDKQLPVVDLDYCKGCGRCITACKQGSIEFSTEINSHTGLTPITLDLETCTSCGLCVLACPEPYGMRMGSMEESNYYRAHPDQVQDYSVVAKDTFEGIEKTLPTAQQIPDERIPVSISEPLIIKGTYASAIGAIFAGCRHFYGYPITPSTEGAELMAKLLPGLDGIFVQAVSEVATVNYMYGSGGAGMRTLTFTSSPGFSLML